jgi:cobalt/nickel transport system permease protein
VLRRGLYLLPFVLFVLVTLPFSAAGETWFDLDLGVGVLTATHEGAARAVDAGLRSGTSIVGLLVLSGTTEATDLFAGLAALKLPRAFVLVLSMVYRYLFLLGSDLARLRRAARARGFSMRSRRSLPRLGTMAGTLLGRSVVRSDRVHKAMLARGFAGEVRTLPRGHFGRAEAVFLVLFYASLALGVVAAFHA